MLNKSGIFKADYATPKQILADPTLQISFGCLVPADIGKTKTEKNLQEALAGESQARNKYTYFASKDNKDGNVQKANI